MKNTNENNKNTGQFYVVTARPDGTMGLVNTGNFDETFKCASELSRHGQFDNGIYLLKILAGLRPDEPIVLKELAFALVVVNEPKAAQPYIEKLKRLWPVQAITAALDGMVLSELGQEEEASKALEKALSAKPTDKDSLKAVISLCMMLNQRISEAERLVRQMQVADPNDQFTWFILGNIRVLQGNKAEAVAAFLRAIEISPNSRHGQRALQRLLEIELPPAAGTQNN